MIIGHVSKDGDIRVSLSIFDSAGDLHRIEGVLDTGFSGYLTLPINLVDQLGLPFRQFRTYELATEVEVELAVHRADVVWADENLRIPVLAADGEPLVGVKMIQGHRLIADMTDGGPVALLPLELS